MPASARREAMAETDRYPKRPPPSSEDVKMLFNVEILEAPVTRSFTDPETLRLKYPVAVAKVGWPSEQVCSLSDGRFTRHLNSSHIIDCIVLLRTLSRAVRETSCLSAFQGGHCFTFI